MSASMMSANKEIVLFATKSDSREVSENPSMLHFAFLYKDEVILTNPSQELPSAMSRVLQEFEDVFPPDTPPGLPPLQDIEHGIDLNLGIPLLNGPPYRVNPKETKEIQRQVQELLDKGYVR